MFKYLENFKRIAIIFGLFLSCTVAQAQTDDGSVSMPWGSQLALIEHTRLRVSDEVDGKCWTNSGSTRSKVYLVLEQNDIFVPDYDPAFFNFQTADTILSAFGYSLDSGVCVVSASFTMQTSIGTSLGGYQGKTKFSPRYRAVLFERSSVFTSPSNSNSQLTDFFTGAASEFAAKALSARRTPEAKQYFETYPSTNEPPISKTRWKEILEEVSPAD